LHCAACPCLACLASLAVSFFLGPVPSRFSQLLCGLCSSFTFFVRGAPLLFFYTTVTDIPSLPRYVVLRPFLGLLPSNFSFSLFWSSLTSIPSGFVLIESTNPCLPPRILSLLPVHRDHLSFKRLRCPRNNSCGPSIGLARIFSPRGVHFLLLG